MNMSFLESEKSSISRKDAKPQSKWNVKLFAKMFFVAFRINADFEIQYEIYFTLRR